MRVVLAVAMASVILSGCLGGSDKGDGDTAAVPTTTGDGLDDAANRTAHAPLANLTADVLNGTAPLNVTFTLRIGDQDGDGLTWTLTFGNTTIANGTSLPAGNGTGTTGNSTGNATGNGTSSDGGRTSASRDVTHQFTEEGNFTVVLNVTDGADSTLANVTITVHAGNVTTQAGAGGPVSEDEWVVFNADGTCDAKGEIAVGGEYFHHRGGDSIWWYEESNDIEGLQVGGSGPFGSDTAYQACLTPDFLIF